MKMNFIDYLLCFCCIGLVLIYWDSKQNNHELEKNIIELNCVIDSMAHEIDDYRSAIYEAGLQLERYKENALSYREDSLNYVGVIQDMREELIINKLKLEQIEEYMKIVNKNPSQSKFLKGWINRVINDK